MGLTQSKLAVGDFIFDARLCGPEGGAVVVLLHGWPDSVLRYERVMPLLADLNVVVPALPGFPFAPPLTKPGMSASILSFESERCRKYSKKRKRCTGQSHAGVRATCTYTTSHRHQPLPTRHCKPAGLLCPTADPRSRSVSPPRWGGSSSS